VVVGTAVVVVVVSAVAGTVVVVVGAVVGTAVVVVAAVGSDEAGPVVETLSDCPVVEQAKTSSKTTALIRIGFP
jgi:hypothetical protein